MKAIKTLPLLFLIIFIPASLAAQEKKDNLETVKFTTSITCDGCVNTIMSNLPLEKGVKNVKCDLQTKEVIVTYKKDKTDSEKLRRSIEKLGYTAKEKKEEEKEKK